MERQAPPTVLHGRVLLKPEATWRHKVDGSYDNRPNNPRQYFRDYYHANRAAKTECKICGAFVAKQSPLRHMRSKGCRRVSQAGSLALAGTVHDYTLLAEPVRKLYNS